MAIGMINPDWRLKSIELTENVVYRFKKNVPSLKGWWNAEIYSLKPWKI